MWLSAVAICCDVALLRKGSGRKLIRFARGASGLLGGCDCALHDELLHLGTFFVDLCLVLCLECFEGVEFGLSFGLFAGVEVVAT